MGNVWRAAAVASVARCNAYDEYDRNPEFARAWDAAEQESADRLEAEAWRRAHDGVDKPVYWQGEKVDTLKEYSDTLLTLLLRARRPSKFRENFNVALGNPDGSKLEIDSRQQAINLFMSSPEAAGHLLALADLMGDDSMKKVNDCAPGNLAHTMPAAPSAPVAANSAPPAKKRCRPKKVAPEAEEIEIDDSDAKPMVQGMPSLAAAFLPRAPDA